MPESDKSIAGYDKVAAKYAAAYMNELLYKPFDRMLLESFFFRNKDKGKFLDLGCGPGQTTAFLKNIGCNNIIGTDLSSEMITIARQLNKDIEFSVEDMCRLTFADNTMGAALAFYSIANLDYPAIARTFSEANRVLKPGGQYLFSFHTGNEVLHLDSFLDESVSMDFYFIDTDRVLELLKANQFAIKDVMIRYPYEKEYQSKRAYVIAEKL